MPKWTDVALGKRDGIGREIGVEDKPPLTGLPDDAQSLLTHDERLATMSNGGQQRLHKLATDLQEIAIIRKMPRIAPAPGRFGC